MTTSNVWSATIILYFYGTGLMLAPLTICIRAIDFCLTDHSVCRNVAPIHISRHLSL